MKLAPGRSARAVPSRLLGLALAAVLAVAACAPLEPSPAVKVRSGTPGVATTASLPTPTAPPLVVLPTLTPTPTATPQPNRRLNEELELGQLLVTVTRAQRYRAADRCPTDSQGVEIDYRIRNRGQETVGVDFIDSTLYDAQGRTLRPNNIQMREVRDVLPGFTERMTYLYCILVDSSGLTLLVAPAVYRGFERQPAVRALVDLEPDGLSIPLAPRATVVPTPPPAR